MIALFIFKFKKEAMLYQEKQKVSSRKFSNIVYCGILLIFTISMLLASNYNDKLTLFFGFLFIFFICIYIFEICFLKIIIDDNGLGIVVHCFFNIKKYYSWQEIKEYKIEKSRPFTQFEGYGVRYNLKNVTGYIFSGAYTLSVELKNNKKIAYTTNSLDQLNLLLINHIKR